MAENTPATISCPECAARFAWVKREKAVRVRCKKCGHAFVVEVEQAAVPPVAGPLVPVKKKGYEEEEKGGDYDLAPAAEPVKAPPTQRLVSAGGVAVVTQADAAFDGGASIRGLSRHFSSFDKAVDYFAQRSMKIHTLAGAMKGCALCGRSEGIRVQRFEWKAKYQTGIGFSLWTLLSIFVGRVIIKRQFRIVGFNTFHGVCPQCWTKLKSMMWVGRAVAMGFGLVAVGALVWLIREASAPGKFDGVEAVKPIVVMVLATAAALAVMYYMNVPLALRKVGRRPFSLNRVRAVKML